MISRRAALCLVLLIGAVLGPMPAGADFHCNVYSGSAENPHLLDPEGDYNGLLSGNGGGVPPSGDINGSGEDVVAAWLVKAANGKWYANIQMKDLTGLEVNSRWSMEWTFEGGDPTKATRFVDALSTRPGPGGAPQLEPRYVFSWGYIASGTTRSIEQEGSTTGTVDLATGIVSIVIPMNRMGNPQPGAVLTDVIAQSWFLTGAAQSGLYFPSDGTDGDPCFELTV